MRIVTIAATACAVAMGSFVAAAQEAPQHYQVQLQKVVGAQARPDKPAAPVVKASAEKSKASKPQRQAKRAKARGKGRTKIDLLTTASVGNASAPASEKSLTVDNAISAVKSAAGYSVLISRYAADYGVPVQLAQAVIRVESNYRVNARGSAGEIGLMQIKPATARMMGYSGNSKGLFSPENNIKYGMKYLGMAHKLSGGSTCGTILRYNAGHAATRMNPVSAAYCSKVKRHIAGA